MHSMVDSERDFRRWIDTLLGRTLRIIDGVRLKGDDWSVRQLLAVCCGLRAARRDSACGRTVSQRARLRVQLDLYEGIIAAMACERRVIEVMRNKRPRLKAA